MTKKRQIKKESMKEGKKIIPKQNKKTKNKENDA